jgi:tetratricopeptide (TPR) repeat protein
MMGQIRYVVSSSVIMSVLFVGIAIGSDWGRGVAFYNKGDYQAALAEFQDIARDRPDAAGAWYYIGLCEFKLKRYKKVELPLSHAIDLLQAQSPDSADIEGAWYTIGFSHYLAGDYGDVIEPLKTYIELTTKSNHQADPNARRALARSYYFLDKYDDALSLLKSSTSSAEQTKDNALDTYYAGAIYFKRGDDDSAIASLNAAAAMNPADADTLTLLTESLMRKAGKSAADADWQKTIEAAEKLKAVKDDLDSANLLGRAYFAAQQFDKAAAPLEAVAKAKPDDGQAWLLYGIALSRSSQSRKAMEALEITIQLLPDSIPALGELAYVYESGKQYQQALRIYEKAYAVSGSTDQGIKASIDRVRALAADQRQD